MCKETQSGVIFIYIKIKNKPQITTHNNQCFGNNNTVAERKTNVKKLLIIFFRFGTKIILLNLKFERLYQYN